MPLPPKPVQPLLRRLLLRGRNKGRLLAAWLAMSIGLFLLFLSVLLWWNFQQLLHGRDGADPLGAAFLTISKTVDQHAMATPGATAFTPSEVAALKAVPGVQDVGALQSNDFPLNASLGGALNFSTLMFLEAAPDRLLDKSPAGWDWKPGNPQVPIILSSDFLNLYNYGFAPSQGLPQLSEQTIRQLPFNLEVGSGARQQTFLGQVAGFSDRINSILVPQSFLDYANSTYGSGTQRPPNRLLVRVADPSASGFVNFLEAKNYVTNKEQLRLNKLRRAVTAISAGTGVLAGVLLLTAMLVLVLFIELTLARAQKQLQLLTELGFSPGSLGRFVQRVFMPGVVGSWGAAVVSACLAQMVAALATRNSVNALPFVAGWPLWLAALLCLLLLVGLLLRSARVEAGKED